MSKSGMNNGGFVPYEQYNPPFVTEDMNVSMTMLKHHIMPDGADIDALADALAEALKRKEKGNNEQKELPTSRQGRNMRGESGRLLRIPERT